MNIVFFGSSQFALPSLKALIASGYDIACVVTQPDKEKGRGLELSATKVKVEAKVRKLEVYQPININTSSSLKFIKSLKPDLFIVIAYGQILSQEVLDIPKLLAINLHASLLPAYRGAAPINWAIIKGEKVSGVTIMKVIKQMDAGPIMLQKKLAIEDSDTAVTLEEKLSKLGAEVLQEALGEIESGTYKAVPQNNKDATLAPKLKKADGLIDWNRPAQDISNLVRGTLPWPGAYTHYKGKLLKIYDAQSIKVSSYQGLKEPGTIADISKDGIAVVTGEGELVIKELQPEGKRRMTASEFLSGHTKKGDVSIFSK
ncbi:MAG: methionyl-tRNA formyltransferase [Candidatus Omnitrophota bacterium]